MVSTVPVTETFFTATPLALWVMSPAKVPPVRLAARRTSIEVCARFPLVGASERLFVKFPPSGRISKPAGAWIVTFPERPAPATE